MFDIMFALAAVYLGIETCQRRARQFPRCGAAMFVLTFTLVVDAMAKAYYPDLLALKVVYSFCGFATVGLAAGMIYWGWKPDRREAR